MLNICFFQSWKSCVEPLHIKMREVCANLVGVRRSLVEHVTQVLFVLDSCFEHVTTGCLQLWI
jgi:hypothetical protein